QRYLLKRLPKPYDTQCYEYSGNETQFQCLDKCYENEYQRKFRCIPKYNSLLTIQLHKYNSNNINFCSNIYINNGSYVNDQTHEYCKSKCPVNCLENLFSLKLQDLKKHNLKYQYYEF